MQSEQKSDEKATLTKLPDVSRPAPDEKGKTKKTCIKFMYFSITPMERDKLYKARVSFTEVNAFILLLFSKRYHKKQLKYYINLRDP